MTKIARPDRETTGADPDDGGTGRGRDDPEVQSFHRCDVAVRMNPGSR